MSERTQGVSEIVGIFFTVIGGLFAIGAGVYVSHHPGSTMAGVLLGLLIFMVKISRRLNWSPVLLGAIVGALCTGLGFAVLYTENHF